MTLTANIKGYINSDEWGVIESAPLWSYEELIAASKQNALAELNGNAESYYNKLNNDGHIASNNGIAGWSMWGVWVSPNCVYWWNIWQLDCTEWMKWPWYIIYVNWQREATD